MNELTFKGSMAFLMKMFGAKIDDEVYAAYWNIFKTFSDEEFIAIQENLIKTFIPTAQVPFPLVIHFLQAAGKAGQNRSRLSVQAVIEAGYSIGSYRSVSFGDPALHQTIERFGGWPVIARWNNDDWKFNEKNFIACYEANLSFGGGSDKCIGIYEQENALKSLIEEKHIKFAEEMAKTIFISWAGFEKQKSLENKSDKREQIKKNEPQKIGEII
jgi:hypothetical protein